jgi:predicted RNA binding protein YcfA (HicA-like mRNA interferase family)
MPKMPVISSQIMIKFLLSLGFNLLRQNGSHKFFKHQDGRTVTIPDHKGDDLGRGITSAILKDIDISKEYFIKWFNK